jgi:adenosylcobyric acid synthase
LPEEDGVAFGMNARGDARNAAQVAVIALPRISNLDEFAPLGNHLRIARTPHDLEHARAIIILGSKSTRADLEWLRATGLVGAISSLAREGIPILGICGELQMLGTSINDSHGIEDGGNIVGLGLLDLGTIFEAEKMTQASTVRDLELNAMLEGYEIHVGRTTGKFMPILKRDVGPLGWRNGNVEV